jgi:pimeloyl-ACP methyl ester carboxylesterase
VLARLAQLQQNPGSADPEQRCLAFWSVLRELYVVEASDAERINWGRCDLPNERSFWRYWSEIVLPSIQKLTFTPKDLAQATQPVLIIHGERDRSSPYGGGRDWAMRLTNARLISIRDAAHAPWIESPEIVFGAIASFLGGLWPSTACTVRSLNPDTEG